MSWLLLEGTQMAYVPWEGSHIDSVGFREKWGKGQERVSREERGSRIEATLNCNPTSASHVTP